MEKKKTSINTVTDFNNTVDKNIIAVPCFLDLFKAFEMVHFTQSTHLKVLVHQRKAYVHCVQTDDSLA